ncbi:MAG: MotE family protein [bacterium]|nr:MotE family protein [bacterium]
MLKIMKNQAGKGNLPLVFILLCVLIGLLIGSVYLFDVLGIFDKEKMLTKIPGIGGFFAPPKITYEDVKIEELRKLKQSVELKLAELEDKDKKLTAKDKKIENRDKELLLLEEELERKKQALEKRETIFEDQEAKWQKLVQYYEGMKPDAAAAILSQMDDQIVIEIFNRMKKTQVAITLMKMDPKRASEISRKMSR